jgi:hypothetical protein
MSENRNTYLDQVVANQERLEQDLRQKRAAAPMAQMAEAPRSAAASGGVMNIARAMGAPVVGGDGFGQAGGGRGSNAVDVRITGRLRWRTVVVPPNAFVVHTRRGRAEPLHVGLGVSFRLGPAYAASAF